MYLTLFNPFAFLIIKPINFTITFLWVELSHVATDAAALFFDELGFALQFTVRNGHRVLTVTVRGSEARHLKGNKFADISKKQICGHSVSIFGYLGLHYFENFFCLNGINDNVVILFTNRFHLNVVKGSQSSFWVQAGKGA